MAAPKDYNAHTTGREFDPDKYGLGLAEEERVGGLAHRFYTRDADENGVEGACIVRESPGDGFDAYHYRHVDSGVSEWDKLIGRDG